MTTTSNKQRRTSLAYVCGNPTYTVDSPSGYATRMRELCHGFEALGLTTSIHLPDGAAEMIQRASTPQRKILKSFVPKGIWEMLRDVARIRSDRRFDRKLAQELSKKPPDILYECLEYSGSVTRHFRNSFSGKFVLEIHGPLHEDAELTAGHRRPLQFFFSRQARGIALEADYIVVVSGIIRDWLVSEGVPCERILVLPNGVNLSDFDPAKFQKRNDPQNRITVGFVGSDLAWHRLDALFHAFASLPRETNAQLIVVGQASENQTLRNLVRENGIEDRVSFTGPIPYNQIPKMISDFDLCVMPGSNRYGSPIKIFEYGAMGKAVIAPDVVPVTEVFENGKDLLLIPSGDSVKLAEAMLRLIQDEPLRKKLGATIQKKVRTQYAWTDIARAIARQVAPEKK